MNKYIYIYEQINVIKLNFVHTILFIELRRAVTQK